MWANVKGASVRMSFYLENFLTSFKPTNGSFSICMDDYPMGLISVDDIGGVVDGILSSPESWNGKAIGVSTENLRLSEVSTIMSEVLGQSIQ